MLSTVRIWLHRITDNITDADKIKHCIDEVAHFFLVVAFIYLLSNGSAAHVLEAQEEAANHWFNSNGMSSLQIHMPRSQPLQATVADISNDAIHKEAAARDPSKLEKLERATAVAEKKKLSQC